MRLSRVLQFEPPIPLWQLGIAAISRKHPYLSGFPIELECTREKRRELKQHLAQMGCYFLLIEEELRIRPTHGFVVCGDGTRHRIENTEELRAWVLGLAGQIRAARREVDQPILVNPKTSNELTILRSRHRSSTNHGGGMRTNIVAEKRTKSVADYIETPDVFVILSHFMISCPYGTGTHHD